MSAARRGRSLTLRTRMLVAFAAIFTLLAFLGVSGVRALRQVHRISSNAETISEIHEVAAGIDAGLQETATALDSYPAGGEELVGGMLELSLDRLEHELDELAEELPFPFETSIDLDATAARINLLVAAIRDLPAAASPDFDTAKGALMIELADLQRLGHEFYEETEEQVTESLGSVAGVMSRLALRLAIVGLAILATIAVAWVFVSRSLGRIRRMTETTVAISAGQLERRVTEDRADEIGLLAGAFNSMTRQLRELIDNLENRVAERTSELSTANAALEQEVRERERAEADMRLAKDFAETVLNSMSDAISIVDVSDYSIVASNTVFQEQCGIGGDEVLGMPCYSVTHDRPTPCGPPDDVCPLVETIENGDSRTVEHLHRTADGIRYVDVSVSPIFDEFGRVQQVVHVSRDITDRKATEVELAHYSKRLEHSNDALQEFAYVASHDLQEPLRKIQSFGSRLQSRYRADLDERGQDYLDRIQGAAGRMQDLIEGLLSYSRITSQAKPFEPVDLNEVAAGVVADLEVRLRESNGSVTVGELPTIDADAVQMRQLFQNLLANALKFARPQVPAQVTISATPAGSDNGQAAAWQITFADNGIGFEQKYAERIFRVFQRLHGRGKYPGTGIGLATCAKIIDRHDGSITALGSPGEGATFTVTLPSRQTRGEQEIPWPEPAKSAS